MQLLEDSERNQVSASVGSRIILQWLEEACTRLGKGGKSRGTLDPPCCLGILDRQIEVKRARLLMFQLIPDSFLTIARCTTCKVFERQ